MEADKSIDECKAELQALSTLPLENSVQESKTKLEDLERHVQKEKAKEEELDAKLKSLEEALLNLKKNSTVLAEKEKNATESLERSVLENEELRKKVDTLQEEEDGLLAKLNKIDSFNKSVEERSLSLLKVWNSMEKDHAAAKVEKVQLDELQQSLKVSIAAREKLLKEVKRYWLFIYY